MEKLELLKIKLELLKIADNYSGGLDTTIVEVKKLFKLFELDFGE